MDIKHISETRLEAGSKPPFRTLNIHMTMLAAVMAKCRIKAHTVFVLGPPPIPVRFRCRGPFPPAGCQSRAILISDSR